MKTGGLLVRSHIDYTHVSPALSTFATAQACAHVAYRSCTTQLPDQMLDGQQFHAAARDAYGIDMETSGEFDEWLHTVVIYSKSA